MVPGEGWSQENLEWDLGGGSEAASVRLGRQSRAPEPLGVVPVAASPRTHLLEESGAGPAVLTDPARSPSSALLSLRPAMLAVPRRRASASHPSCSG